METKIISGIKKRQEEHFSYRDGMSPTECRVKRCFDVVCAIIGLFIFSPLILCIYIAIKCEDKGTVIFKQERIGHRGKTFILYKFRSMIMTAEINGKPKLCMKDDYRLTKIGTFLRDHHLDELPQLWNVLKGDMSFVGPRPERRYFVNQIMSINSNYELLYQLRPGLFSFATLYNGYTDTMEKMLERLRMDLDYLSNRSFSLDLRIITITFISIIMGKKF